MNSSNPAQRLDVPEIDAPAPQTPRPPPAELHAVPAPTCAPRPRRTLEFRTIVIRDQGFAPFRVR